MEDSDEDARPRKRGSEKVKAMKRQKKAIDEKKLPAPKAKKVAKRNSDRSNEDQDENSEEEDNSQSSAEEDNKVFSLIFDTLHLMLFQFVSHVLICRKNDNLLQLMGNG
jgi:hypothetical protein